MTLQPSIKPKPWGREIWWANHQKYAGKILEVKAGGRLSLQYHRYKEETQYVVSGKVRVHYGESATAIKTKILNPGDVWHNAPRMIHRLEGIAPLSVIFEVSTPHLTDVFRIQDDYARPKSGNHEQMDSALARAAKPAKKTPAQTTKKSA